MAFDATTLIGEKAAPKRPQSFRSCKYDFRCLCPERSGGILNRHRRIFSAFKNYAILFSTGGTAEPSPPSAAKREFMEHRNWNKNNIRTSLLGYGCMRFPTKADGTIDEERAEALLNTAKAAGVNYFDTAYPYHNGRVSRLWAA